MQIDIYGNIGTLPRKKSTELNKHRNDFFSYKYVNMYIGYVMNPNELNWDFDRLFTVSIEYYSVKEFDSTVFLLNPKNTDSNFRYCYYVGLNYIDIFTESETVARKVLRNIGHQLNTDFL